MTVSIVIDDLRSRLDEKGLDFDGSREAMLAILGENMIYSSIWVQNNYIYVFKYTVSVISRFRFY